MFIIDKLSMESIPQINLSGPSGTRDFFPADKKAQNYLFDKFKKISINFGFVEYDGPVLENADLYTRKGGDDILHEMYSFVDREGKKVCLRPEMTPTVSRMVMSTYGSEIAPFKWFTIAQCWRFENVSRGRKREHYQWNADIFGAVKIKSEVEILSMVIELFKAIGLTSNDIVIKISNRSILQKVLTKMGVDDDLFENACNIIDKIKKITSEQFIERLTTEIKLSVENISTLIELISTTDITKLSVFLDASDETILEMIKIFYLLEKLGYSDWITLDLAIVRGLSYYTGMVFEAFMKEGTLNRSICGGGRYDKLLQTYGYKECVPAVGFGFGDVVITEILTEKNLIPDCSMEVDYCVISFNEDLYPEALKLSNLLRTKSKSVTTYTECNGKLRLAYSYADRIGAKIAILIAPTEYANNEIVIKDLRKNSTIESKKSNCQTIKMVDFLDNL